MLSTTFLHLYLINLLHLPHTNPLLLPGLLPFLRLLKENFR